MNTQIKIYKTKSFISKILFFTVTAFCSAVAVSAQTPEKPADSVKNKSRQEIQRVKLTARKGRGKKDINLKPVKRKARRRGNWNTVCNIEIKNSTRYIVAVYVDGREKGFAYKNSFFKTTNDVGRVKIYTRTDLVNSNYLYWGPNYFTCGTSIRDGFVSLEVESVRKN